MKVDKKHFTFQIKWKDVKSKEEMSKRMKDVLVGLGWCESENDMSYTDVMTFHFLNDCTCEATVCDKFTDSVSRNKELSEQLFEALKKTQAVEDISLLDINEETENMIFVNFNKVRGIYHQEWQGKGENTCIYHLPGYVEDVSNES